MDHDALYQAPYIVWVDYGVEGWRPRPAISWEDAVKDAMHGYSSPVVITSGAFMPKRP